MGENSRISWTHNTLNFWVGCDKIAPECAKCYISRSLSRMGREPWGAVYRTKTWIDATRWQNKHAAAGHAIRVFTCSLSDFFHAKADEWRPLAWQIIRDTPNLVYLILTKRPERIARCLPSDWPYRNVWLGVSTGCRMTLNKMDLLRRVEIHPEAVRWISAEPLLEDVSLDINLDGIGWVVTGGESGHGREYLWNSAGDWRAEFEISGRRTMRLEWAEKLLELTKAAGLPFLFKQVTSLSSGTGANALGREWHEFPAAPSGLSWAPTMGFEKQQGWTPVQIADYRKAANARI